MGEENRKLSQNSEGSFSQEASCENTLCADLVKDADHLMEIWSKAVGDRQIQDEELEERKRTTAELMEKLSSLQKVRSSTLNWQSNLKL